MQNIESSELILPGWISWPDRMPKRANTVFHWCIMGLFTLNSSFSSYVLTNRKREIWSWLQESASHSWRRTELWLSRITIWRNAWDKSQRRSDRSEHVKWLMPIIYKVCFEIKTIPAQGRYTSFIFCNFTSSTVTSTAAFQKQLNWFQPLMTTIQYVWKQKKVLLRVWPNWYHE